MFGANNGEFFQQALLDLVFGLEVIQSLRVLFVLIHLFHELGSELVTRAYRDDMNGICYGCSTYLVYRLLVFGALFASCGLLCVLVLWPLPEWFLATNAELDIRCLFDETALHRLVKFSFV